MKTSKARGRLGLSSISLVGGDLILDYRLNDEKH